MKEKDKKKIMLCVVMWNWKKRRKKCEANKSYQLALCHFFLVPIVE